MATLIHFKHPAHTPGDDFHGHSDSLECPFSCPALPCRPFCTHTISPSVLVTPLSLRQSVTRIKFNRPAHTPGDDLHGHSDGLEWPLLDTVDAFCLHGQSVADGHLAGAASWHQPGVKADVACNTHGVGQVALHLPGKTEVERGEESWGCEDVCACVCDRLRLTCLEV